MFTGRARAETHIPPSRGKHLVIHVCLSCLYRYKVLQQIEMANIGNNRRAICGYVLVSMVLAGGKTNLPIAIIVEGDVGYLTWWPPSWILGLILCWCVFFESTHL